VKPQCDPLSALTAFVEAHPRLFVLTGAGVSTASGIPGYRDVRGEWQRKQPITHQEFTGSEAARKRYWARSMIGFGVMAHAAPNAAHRALAQLEQTGHIEQLVTQNVDGLHQRAGSAKVIELHGGIGQVVCLDCSAHSPRGALQARLEAANPAYRALPGVAAPDGDADIEAGSFASFLVPACLQCGGMLKPDVVFFGANVPPARKDAAMAALLRADAVLVAGSSLMVHSGYRFCERAHALGKPLAAINLGRTRADTLLDVKVEQDCAGLLTRLAQHCAPDG
jgi:NAD-dependent SIR2 family protein deacetylase